MSNHLIITGHDFSCFSPSNAQGQEVEEFTSALQYFRKNFDRDTTVGSAKDACKYSNARLESTPWKKLAKQKRADRATRFLLLYEAPELVFASVYKASKGDLAVVEAELESWAETNRTMLNFYFQNREISALMKLTAAWEHPADFAGICSSVLSVEPNQGAVEKPVSDLPLEALACQLIGNFSSHQALYGKLQLAASLPGEDLNQSRDALSRDKHISQLAAQSRLFDRSIALELCEAIKVQGLLEAKLGDVREELDRLKTRKNALEQELNDAIVARSKVHDLELENRSLKEDVDLSLLQIHHLQEELENYYLKYEALRGKDAECSQKINVSSPVSIARPADFATAEEVSVVGKYSEPGYQDLHINVKSLSLADGRMLDSLPCKLVLKSGMPGLELRESSVGNGIVSSWPKEMQDEHGNYMLVLPSAAEEDEVRQRSLMAALSTSDRQVLVSAANILRDHFVAGRVRGADDLIPSDLRAWRKASIDLVEQLREIDSFLTFDDVDLKEEFLSDTYNHLWLVCHNFQFGKKKIDEYGFKLIVSGEGDDASLLLEFRDLPGNLAPLEAWPPNAEDEHGRKLYVTMNLEGKYVIADAEHDVSQNDELLIADLARKVPGLLSELIKAELNSKNSWDFWNFHAGKLNDKPIIFGPVRKSRVRRALSRLRR